MGRDRVEAGYSRIPPRIGRDWIFFLCVRPAVFENMRFDRFLFILLRRILCSFLVVFGVPFGHSVHMDQV